MVHLYTGAVRAKYYQLFSGLPQAVGFTIWGVRGLGFWVWGLGV